MLEGVVERGEGRGAGLGVPTANLGVDGRRAASRLPASTQAGWTSATAGVPAATGIGTRPTFGGGSVTVEAHVLDFDGDLYGRMARLALTSRIRAERAFTSIAAAHRGDGSRYRADPRDPAAFAPPA